jgi:phosphoribosylformylglycinamidine synthase
MRIEIATRSDLKDGRAHKVLASFDHLLPGLIRDVRLVEVYCVPEQFTLDEKIASDLFCDLVSQEFSAGEPLYDTMAKGWDSVFEVAFKAGVTDPVGITATEAIKLELGLEGQVTELVQSARQFVLWTTRPLAAEERTRLANSLFNPLIQRVEAKSAEDVRNGFRFPARYRGVQVSPVQEPEFFDIAGASDEELLKISKTRLLALTLDEMKVIQAYFRDPATQKGRQSAGMRPEASDVELEMMGQTWSEHCKHKIFAAEVHYEDPETGEKETIPGLFKSYIRATTEALADQRPDLRSMFHDNAGVVDFDDDHVVCFKVETHNSPSALDPYGGAITGIVGVNRDILGTGKGAKPLFNTNVLCFADPATPVADVPAGLLHPRRIMHGVHEGIIDGGNQSGIPTVAGGFVFDESYLGKPLVYCGTGGIMPRRINGEESWIKHVDAGDLAVMVGGRIGKDGIHGATFSSLALDEDSPNSAVQIGDPITQRKVWDFLMEARDLGLYKGITDNGAGGISSSLGEMATASGGVAVDLDKCPLKYPGLSPWEIWVSESQERMSLAVSADQIEALLDLARRRSVEATVIGSFTDNGFIDLKYGGKRVAWLSMDFVHDGLPKMKLKAKWIPSSARRADAATAELAKFAGDASLKSFWLKTLAQVNVRSREELVRQYDHEVQGNTMVKPYQGMLADAPSDGSVIRPVRENNRGLSVTHGICPRVGDDDTYKMALCAVDEAYRSHIALGGDPNGASLLDNFCWPDPVESPETPDGAYKMAQLVRANKALKDACLAYNLPLISGKDSMKNDARLGGKKISVRPTLLVSLMGIVPDVRLTPSAGFVAEGDSIFLVGETRRELSGSVLEHLLQAESSAGINHLGLAPAVNLAHARVQYEKLALAIRHGLVRSAHDLSDGGLAVALAESAFHQRLGFRIDLNAIIAELSGQTNTAKAAKDWPAACWGLLALFAETPSRLLVSVPRGIEDEFIAQMDGSVVHWLGEVRDDRACSITWNFGSSHFLTLGMDEALSAWKRGWND